MYTVRITILILLHLLIAARAARAQLGFGAPVYWQHFGISPKGDAIAGPALAPGRTSFQHSTTLCPPPGFYTIIKRVPVGSCFNDEWIPLSHDQNGTYDLTHAEGNLMLVNNTIANTPRLLYIDTVQQALCPGIDYFFFCCYNQCGLAGFLSGIPLLSTTGFFPANRSRPGTGYRHHT